MDSSLLGWYISMSLVAYVWQDNTSPSDVETMHFLQVPLPPQGAGSNMPWFTRMRCKVSFGFIEVE